jgi:uncharacterized protein YjdB
MRISRLTKFHFFISNASIRIIRLKILISFCSILLYIPSLAQTAGYYGTNWGADGLANTIIGKYAGRQADYRFRSEYTGSVIQLRIYLVYASGYSGGTGGKLTISLETDDGTVNHLPSGTVLTSVTDKYPMRYGGRGYQPLYIFQGPANLTQGKLYHLRITNSDSDPINNYVSINELWVDPPGGNYDRIPTGNITDLALLTQESSEPWIVTTTHTPIFTLYYADSHMQGQGYIGSSSGTPRDINGTNSKVRSNITVSGANKTVDKVWVRLKKVSGTDDLTIRLENSGGTLIEEGTVSSSTIKNTMTWVSLTFLTTHILSSGSTYHLVLSAGSGTIYQTYPLQDGSREYGYVPMFSDGHFEYCMNGSNWTDGTTSDFKSQIYFSNQPVSVIGITIKGTGESNNITTDKGTLQLISSVLPSDASNKTVTWSITNGIGQATISSSGLVSAIGNGTVTAVATATDGSGASGTFFINISNQAISGDTAPTPVNQPPVITISSPSKGNKYENFSSVTLEAIASDPDGTIAKVEFYNGSEKLVELISPPYSYIWKNIDTGKYSITAIATDNLDATTTSLPVELKVSNSSKYDVDSNILKLFPNPNDGHFSIEFVNPLQNAKSYIIITDITGKQVYNGQLSKEETLKQFDLSNIKSGVYIMMIVDKEILITKKFIKK